MAPDYFPPNTVQLGDFRIYMFFRSITDPLLICDQMFQVAGPDAVLHSTRGRATLYQRRSFVVSQPPASFPLFTALPTDCGASRGILIHCDPLLIAEEDLPHPPNCAERMHPLPFLLLDPLQLL